MRKLHENIDDQTQLLTSFDVSRQVHLVGQFSDAHIESLLDIIEDFGILIVAYKSDGQTLGTETTSTSNSVKVGVGILGHVVIEDNVNSLDIHTTAEQVGSNQDTLLEVLELLISGQTFFLGHRSVDGNGGEVLVNQELGKSHATLHTLHEDDNLVEFQSIEKLKQFPVLLLFLDFHVMLLETMKSQFSFIININFHGL